MVAFLRQIGYDYKTVLGLFPSLYKAFILYLLEQLTRLRDSDVQNE
jgi:hypothetical protein